MSRRPPKDTDASVKQRLLNLARERGEDFNFLLTRYAIERLLYRLDQSDHAGEFILKGAMLFHLSADRLPHRPTRDVDLLGRGTPDLARLAQVFRDICAVAVEPDGMAFSQQSVRAERIRENQEYEGVRVRVEGRMGSARIPLQVDVGFGDALTPPAKRRRLATLLDFPAPRLLIYPWETVIAEKLQALVSLGMANSRLKDLFDLHHLLATQTFEGSMLARAIEATFERRRTPLPEHTPVGLSRTFAEDPAKQAQWRAFLRRHGLGADTPPLNEVIEEIRAFLLPPIEALLHQRPFTVQWPPRGPWGKMT